MCWTRTEPMLARLGIPQYNVLMERPTRDHTLTLLAARFISSSHYAYLLSWSITCINGQERREKESTFLTQRLSARTAGTSSRSSMPFHVCSHFLMYFLFHLVRNSAKTQC